MINIDIQFSQLSLKNNHAQTTFILIYLVINGNFKSIKQSSESLLKVKIIFYAALTMMSSSKLKL